jgi:dihydroflavonol-4-reductase
VRSLVTGATGFLGRHLIDVLVADGHNVRALVRPRTDGGSLTSAGVEIVRGDISDERALRTAAAGCERVYHLAGVVSHRRRDRALLHEVHVEGTRRVLGVVEPGARVVHVSSVATVGPVSSPRERAAEEHVMPAAASRLPYAASKREGERVVLAAAERGVDAVIANPGFLLGPGDRYRISTWPVSAFLAGRLRFTTAGGLSFVDARDVARGLVALAEHGRPGERTILTAEQGNLTWDEFFATLATLSGVRRFMVSLPPRLAIAGATLVPWPVSADDVRAAAHWWFFSPAKAERELAFSTRPLAETLRDTIADHAATTI